MGKPNSWNLTDVLQKAAKIKYETHIFRNMAITVPFLKDNVLNSLCGKQL
jgi:hypothetical protein